MPYELWYWPTIQGRGEFVRLALEEADAPYRDVAREPGGECALVARLSDGALAQPPFAPPFLRAGRTWLAQTANILLFLGERHGLAPRDVAARHFVHALQLTVADLVAEVHDTHHPIAASLYYEDQRTEAARRARHLSRERLPKYLGYFERVLERNGRARGWLVGGRLTYADLSLFQVVAGLRYAFPASMQRLARRHPRVLRLHAQVRERPRIARYLASPRRIAFNEEGIFRHYAELDGARSPGHS
jgi:glutathione S-transferase